MTTNTTTTDDGKSTNARMPLAADNRPFAFRYAMPPRCASYQDDLTSEDPLPAILEITPSGTERAHETYITEVKQETIDEQ